MTEAEWLTCENPWVMLDFVRPRMTGHKAMALATTFDILLSQLQDQGNEQSPLETAGDIDDSGPSSQDYLDPDLLIETLLNEVRRIVLSGSPGTGNSASAWPRAERMRMLCGFLRDLFNLYCPVIVDRVWLTANSYTAHKIAVRIEDDRAFDCMPILADALEDAGCTDPAILEHLRGAGPHLRGCWVVNLLLGKS